MNTIVKALRIIFSLQSFTKLNDNSSNVEHTHLQIYEVSNITPPFFLRKLEAVL